MPFDNPWNQAGSRVRFDWGPTGAAQAEAETAVVVDVLSFTTCVEVATARGARVYPWRWAEDPTAYAERRGAVVAAHRGREPPGEVTLSPPSLRDAPALDRVVLPSPNGSTIAVELARRTDVVVAACLRNCAAVAGWIRSRAPASVLVVAAGERWPDDTLRPAVEDLWGAGAVIADLEPAYRSVEADMAAGAWATVAGGPPLETCASGQELLQRGYAEDVAMAGEVAVSTVVPVWHDGAFVAV